MRILKLFFCLVFYTLSAFGQSSEQFTQISHNDLSNCEVVTSKYYKGESLWGLINGGADALAHLHSLDIILGVRS